MNRLYETIRTIKGIDYRYWGFGKVSKSIGPKNDPTKINEANILGLLNYLDQQEENDLKLYQDDRQKLVNTLSEDYKIKYQELRKEMLQTRLRPPEIQIDEEDIVQKSKQFSKFLAKRNIVFNSPSFEEWKKSLEKINKTRKKNS